MQDEHKAKEGLIQIYEQPGATNGKPGDNTSLRRPPKSAPGLSDKEKPMGRISGVRARDMLFQIQTEFVTHPENQVVTIVMLDGRVVTKRTKQLPPNRVDRGELAKMIEELHASVEKEVNAKIKNLISRKTGSEETIREKVERLFEEGFDKCKEHNYKAALAVWQEAYTLNPVNKVLAANIRILLRKLNLTDDFCRHSSN